MYITWQLFTNTFLRFCTQCLVSGENFSCKSLQVVILNNSVSPAIFITGLGISFVNIIWYLLKRSLYTGAEYTHAEHSPFSHSSTSILSFWLSLPIFLRVPSFLVVNFYAVNFLKHFLASNLITVPLNVVRGCGSCTITYWCGPDALFQTNKSFFPFGGSEINLFKSLCAPVVPFTQPTHGKLWFLNIVFSAPLAL